MYQWIGVLVYRCICVLVYWCIGEPLCGCTFYRCIAVCAMMSPCYRGLAIFQGMGVTGAPLYGHCRCCVRRTGVPVCQCTVVPAYLCTCVLTYRCTIVLVYWCTGVLAYRCTGVPLYHCTGVPVYHCAGVPLYHCTGVPLLWIRLCFHLHALLEYSH